jgi:hypothetical protein
MAARTFALAAGLLILPMAGSAMAQDTPAAPATAAAPVATDRPAPRVPPGVTGPIATLPGFEMQADGGSKLFVELTQSVPVEEQRSAQRITYLLKGARVLKRNNENALVTVHFNTPVTSARLLPEGGSLAFIVNLRANVTPTWKMTPAKDNSAILEIVFPKGDFLKGVVATDDSATPGAPGAGDSSAGGTDTGANVKPRRTRQRHPKPKTAAPPPTQAPAPAPPSTGGQ